MEEYVTKYEFKKLEEEVKKLKRIIVDLEGEIDELKKA